MPQQKDSFLHFDYPLNRTLMFVGMPGCGKSSIGKRVARIYSVPFVDSDIEVEQAGGGSCVDLFARFGEAEFRRGEELVIERLLNGPVCVLSSGGGSFLSERTRENARKKAVTVYLDADVKTLIRNTAGRSHRPLLNTGNPEETIRALMEKRRPFFETADIVVRYKNETLGQLLRRVVGEVNQYAKQHP